MNSRSRTRFVSIMWFVWTAVCGAVLSLAAAFLYLNPQIPTAETYRHVRIETPLRVFANGGELMAEFGERRVIPLKITDVPPLFIRALLDTEDKRFYSHGGVDFISLLNDSIELALNREKPEKIAGQVDEVVGTLTDAEKVLDELEFATGRTDGDELFEGLERGAGKPAAQAAPGAAAEIEEVEVEAGGGGERERER